MSLRRSSLQISIELLTAISHGEYRPTRLMYECNMSWKSIRNTLALLESKGLVDDLSVDEKRKRYCVTSKGRDVLGYYSGLEELVQVS
jgi:predicted transcriptional regulator